MAEPDPNETTTNPDGPPPEPGDGQVTEPEATDAPAPSGAVDEVPQGGSPYDIALAKQDAIRRDGEARDRRAREARDAQRATENAADHDAEPDPGDVGEEPATQA